MSLADPRVRYRSASTSGLGLAMTSRFTRTDGWILLALVALAAVPRFWDLAAVGLTHFDEGAYAMSAQAMAEGDLPDGLYPLQHYLSPPLYFGLGGLLMSLFGASDQVMLWLSALFGTLTVPLIFVLGRRWNGRAAGASASLLVALSAFHVAYSRIGLTDVTFLFFFLLALLLYSLVEERESLAHAVLAGIAVGLAWNTKYHGWLAAAIALLALVPSLRRGGRGRFVAGLRRWFVSVVVAGLLYLPWAVWVMNQPGGYAALAKEHASFLGDAASFLDHIVSHLRAQLELEDWAATVAPALAFAVAWCLSVGGRRTSTAAWLLPLLVGAFAVGEMAVAVVLAMRGLVAVLQRGAIGGRLQVAALLVFTVLTPLYFPYNRLLLPWAVLVFLFAGAGLAALVGPIKVRGRPVVLASVWVVGALAWIMASGFPTPERGERPRPEGFRRVSDAVPRSEPETVFWVIGEPAVVFYLRARGVEAWHADSVGDILRGCSAGEIVYVVSGYYARRTRELERWRREHTAESASGTASGVVGDVRLLDDLRRGEPWSRVKGSRDYDLEVVRLVVPQ